MPDDLESATYLKLQDELDAELGPMANWGWVHRCYHLLFPEKLDDYHSTEWQTFYLVKLLQKPIRFGKRYAVAGQFMRPANQIGLRVTNFITALMLRFGSRHKYWRVGTSDGKFKQSYWEEMRENGCISVGWPALGDARQFDSLDDVSAKKSIRDLIAETIPTEHRLSPGQRANSLRPTEKRLPGMLCSYSGKKVLGIGRVIGDYEYHEHLGFPHIRKGQWLVEGGANLPRDNEGLRTILYLYKDPDNLLEIEERVRAWAVIGKSTPAPMIEKIRRILTRKGQVILYGPPGTGKTYWAEQASLELALQKAFGSILPF